jgi:hypothetical protein
MVRYSAKAPVRQESVALFRGRALLADVISMDATVDAPSKRVRPGAVAIAVALVLALAIGGGALANWIIHAREDPYAAAGVPELGLPVFDYTVMPTLGQVFTVGDVDVVLMSTVVLEEGGTALHFVLRREGPLPQYDVRLTSSGNQRPGGDESTSMCEASGRTGWGECYLRVPASLGDTVTLNLVIDREPVGSFDLTIPNWDGSLP